MPSQSWWSKFIDQYFHGKVDGAYREEKTGNQVVGCGIEFSLPALDRSSSRSFYYATTLGMV